MSKYGAWRSFIVVFSLAFCLMESGCKTGREYEGDADDACAVSSEATHDTLRKLNEIIIPEMSFFAPATIIDVVEFLKQASREYDTSEAPPDKRGVTIDLRLPCGAKDNAPKISALYLRSVSLRDALMAVCEMTDMGFHVRGDDGRVMIGRSGFDEDWATRSYDIPDALAERLFRGADGQTPARDPNQVWQAFFDELGVTGPEFASFEYLPTIGKLRVTNTPENLAIIDYAFDAAVRTDALVNIEVQVHAFRTKDIERLNLAGDETLDALLALRGAGKGKPVASASVWAKSGQEVVMKAVQEVRYPTAFMPAAGHSISNGAAGHEAAGLIPGGFEVRETGMTLQAVPEIRMDGGGVDLAVNPKWVSLEGWENWSALSVAGRKAKMQQLRQPVFGVTSVQTRLALADGETVLLGSCSTPDGEWVHVSFLSAKLQYTRLGGDGRLGNGPRETVHPKNPTAATSEASRILEKTLTIVIPEVTFRPPATILDAMDFFVRASREHDDPKLPADRRGLSFALKLPVANVEPSGDAPADPFAAPATLATNVVPQIPALSARFVNLYDALKVTCDATGMKFRIKNGVVWIVPASDSSDVLLTRFYPAWTLQDTMKQISGESGAPDGGFSRDATGQPDWKTIFQQMGVGWPVEGSIRHLPTLDCFCVVNTLENFAVLDAVFDDLCVYPRRVQVDVQIHAFRSEDMERLRLSGEVSVASLNALRKEGRSRPVASASVTTASGQEAVVKAVREVTYPTEFGWLSTTATNGPSCAANRLLTPDGFELREIGMLLQVLPEVVYGPDLIDLKINPLWVTLDRWDSYPAVMAAGRTHKTLPLRQPVFGATSFQSQLTVADGGTVLLGNSATPDGKWVHVGFLTARRVNVQSGVSENSP